MWQTVPSLSRGSVPIFREMYEMSQVCLVYYSWNLWNIIEHPFCNATSLEYPLDTWWWLASSLNIPSSFVHINWILQSLKKSFKNSLDRMDDVLHYPYFAATSGLVNTVFVKWWKLIYQFNVQHKPKSKIWKDMSQIPCILLRSCSRSCTQPLAVSLT